jgi:transcriptional regulator with XRE-family HTH domain
MPNWSALNNRARRAIVRKRLLGRELDEQGKAALENAEIVQEAARFLRQMREEAGLTQQQLGEKLGIKQARISELERGGTPEGMSYGILRRAAIACGLDNWPPPPTAVKNRPRRFAYTKGEIFSEQSSYPVNRALEEAGQRRKMTKES